MALDKQSDFMIALLTTALILVSGITTTNVDCKGKAFHCVNSTHFKICVDFGGVSKTVDDFLIPCPPSTACTDSNYYECEIPTTSAPLARQSDVTNELFETTVTSPWELLDVITLSPINNNEKSVEWLENSTIASPEIVSTAAGTETVEIVDYKVVNEVINEMTTESEYIIHKTTSDFSESNNSKSTNSIPISYMTSLAITDDTGDLSRHNISANISSASVTTGNNSTTESNIWMDVFDTMTTSSNTKDDADFKSTNLFNSVITDSLKKNNLTAALTTENYSGTKSEISIDHKSFITEFPDVDKIPTTLSFPLKSNDFRLNIAEEATKNYEVTEVDTSISLLEQVETRPKNIEGSEYFATTISLVPSKTDDLSLKSSLATETKEKSGAKNETSITNNKVNTHFTTTLLVPLMIKSLQNTPNIEINLSVTSDSYSTSTEQYSTVSYKNSPTETATTTNDMYTIATVTGTGAENETMIMNNNVNPNSTKTTLSAPMITEGLLNTSNIETYLAATSDSYSTSTEQYSTVSYKNSPTETATTTNEMYTNATVTGTGAENETMIINNNVNPRFTKTTLSAPIITEGLLNTSNIETYLTATSDSYSTSTEQYSTVSYKNSPTETATTTNEMYTNANVNGTGTENETLITNNKVNPHFTTTSLSAPMITEVLVNIPNIEIYLSNTSDSYSTSFEQFSTLSDTNTPTETATTTNELYTNATITGIGTKNETFITNHEVNPHFTTTPLSAPMITESLINTQNIEINFTVTSDSNSASTEQYSTMRDNNSTIETAASTNQMYTNDVTNTSDNRLDGYSLNENDMNINRIEEISSSSPIQMELNSTTTGNVVLRDTLQVFSIYEQNRLSSPVGSVVYHNAENVTSSDITKITTVTDLDQTNTQANVLYTKAPIVNENIILDTDGTSTTKLGFAINENNLMRENIANSSTDIKLSTRLDSSETNAPKNTPETDTNSRTPTTRTVSDTYTTVTNKDSQVDEFSIYENDSSTVPLSDFLSTVGCDKELHSTTAVNIVLKNTADIILTKEQSEISPQKSESHAISDLINKEPLQTILQPTLAIGLTVNYISYDVNFSTTTVNGNKLHKNVAKKISNNTKEEFLRHENGIYENIIDEITTPLPQIADFKSTAKAENVATSFIGSLNDTVEELKMTGISDLSPPVTTGSPFVSEIIKTSLPSDITESYYVVNTEPHIDVTKVKLPIFSTIHETIQNNPTAQNIVTETLDGTENEHGSTQNFEIQQHGKITNFDSVSSPSVFQHFSKHNDNSTEPFNNTLKESDSDSNMMYGSSHPLNLSTSTSKSNTKYTAVHNTEHTINLTIIGNLTATSATQPRITLNDTVLNFSAFEPIFNLTIGNDITPTEYQNQPSTVNNVNDNIITTHSYIRDGTGESSHLTEGDILKTTLLNENPSMNTLKADLNPSGIINDRYNSVSDDIYSSTSAKNTVTENYNYKNNIPDYLIDSSTPSISVIDSFDLNTVISTLVTGSSSFADAYLPSNITSMGFEYKYTTKENVFTLTNVPKDSSQIFVTNEKPVYTATIYRNVNSSTKSNTLKGTKVVELEQLVSEDTNKIFASDSTSDIGSLTTENTLSLNPTLSKNISRQHILSANINKDINATKEKITRDSVMSGRLYVQDKILKSKHLQNTSIITNESPQYHKNNNTYNFTKQINNSIVVNTNANLYNANVKITERKQNQTLDSVSKSIVNFNNLSINVENLTRHDQNSSYKNVSNETRVGDMQLNFVINADKSLSNPVQANEDKRKVHITEITPVKVNNLPGNEIERTEFKFNCDSLQRGKYSDKNDCQNFYICTGRDEPIIGKCPNNTIFSEILKQCSRNLSHCIRNNQFQCTSAGRFVDILSDKFYYICAKKVKGYIRFKFQCQKGYHLDQSKLKCILDTFNESLSAFELSSLDMDMTNEESSKTDGERTIESRSDEEKDSKEQKKDFECKKEGKFLYPDDCRKYYQCSKTGESKFRRKIKKCDSDEVFDKEMRKCVDEESYEC